MLSFLYDSGADGHYPIEAMRKATGLAILGKLTKIMIVADGNTAKGKHRVSLPFKALLPKPNEANTFKQFNNLLLSVDKVNDKGNISIFTSNGVTIHKEEDFLITCESKPILVGIQNNSG